MTLPVRRFSFFESSCLLITQFTHEVYNTNVPGRNAGSSQVTPQHNMLSGFNYLLLPIYTSGRGEAQLESVLPEDTRGHSPGLEPRSGSGV